MIKGQSNLYASKFFFLDFMEGGRLCAELPFKCSELKNKRQNKKMKEEKQVFDADRPGR